MKTFVTLSLLAIGNVMAAAPEKLIGRWRGLETKMVKDW